MEKYRLLFESVFKKKLTDEDAVSYLKKLTAEHPYFSIAQFYLLQLTPKGNGAYNAQAKKAAALFNNNYWLNFQLLEATGQNTAAAATGKGSVDEAFISTPEVAGPVPAKAETFSIEDNRYDEVIEEKQPGASMEDEKPEEEIKAEESGVEEPVVINEPLIAGQINSAEEVIEEEPLPGTAEVKIAEEIKAEESGVEEPVVINEPIVAGNDNTVEKVIEEELPVNKERELPVPVAEEHKTIEEVVVDNTVPEANEPAAAKEPVIEKPANEPLLFEPLHTTDYFASVGIKLSEEEKTGDKLGKQLKSFTEWLKTMKKIHASELTNATRAATVETAAAESTIQVLAEKSNQENEVITEAMADVLLQQDRRDKAIEILEKLSLLNPSKSTYFAAKINQIKEV